MTASTPTLRWYVIGEPCLLRHLLAAGAGDHPGVLMAELYSSAMADPRPMLAVLELDHDGAPPLEVPPPTCQATPAGYTMDPDVFLARFFLIAEPVLRGVLEAAAGGEPAQVLGGDLWAAGADDANPHVRMVELPVETPALGFDLAAVTTT